jgi:menaquinone-9 beta-reductase
VGGLEQASVLVIGGGPAGLAAAIAAQLKGFQVTVCDGACPPIDKSCGEGILPAGVEALRRLGVSLSGDGLPFRGVRFVSGEASLEARFRADWGVALRRTRLHDLLARRAAAVGVHLRWGTAIRSVSGLSAYRWVVGADGQRSSVRQEVLPGGARLISTRFGFRRHYRLSPWTDMVEVHWGTHCQVYVTPVSADEIGVALLSRDSHLRLDTALEEFPALNRRLRSGRFTSTERGAATTSRRLRRVFLGHTALTGDASGSVDAITGEGLSLSFLQAHALADAMAAGDLNLYQAAHRRLGRHAATIGNMLLFLDRFPWLRRAVFQLLALGPSIPGRLLANQGPAACDRSPILLPNSGDL